MCWRGSDLRETLARVKELGGTGGAPFLLCLSLDSRHLQEPVPTPSTYPANTTPCCAFSWALTPSNLPYFKQPWWGPAPLQSDSCPGQRGRLILLEPRQQAWSRHLISETRQGQCPAGWSNHSPGKRAEGRDLVSSNYKTKAAPVWPLNQHRDQTLPQQAKWVTVANWTEGRHGSARTVGCMQHTSETPLKQLLLVSRTHGTTGHYRTSSS